MVILCSGYKHVNTCFTIKINSVTLAGVYFVTCNSKDSTTSYNVALTSTQDKSSRTTLLVNIHHFQSRSWCLQAPLYNSNNYIPES